MSNIIHPEIKTGTAASGSFTVNTQFLSGILGQVIVEPTTSTTQYDISITDKESIKIYERTSEIGTIAEEVLLPVYGIYTISISNATVDEAFTVKLSIND